MTLKMLMHKSIISVQAPALWKTPKVSWRRHASQALQGRNGDRHNPCMLLDNVVGTPHHAIALWVLCIMDVKVLANRASAKGQTDRMVHT